MVMSVLSARWPIGPQYHIVQNEKTGGLVLKEVYSSCIQKN